MATRCAIGSGEPQDLAPVPKRCGECATGRQDSCRARYNCLVIYYAIGNCNGAGSAGGFLFVCPVIVVEVCSAARGAATLGEHPGAWPPTPVTCNARSPGNVGRGVHDNQSSKVNTSVCWIKHFHAFTLFYRLAPGQDVAIEADAALVDGGCRGLRGTHRAQVHALDPSHTQGLQGLWIAQWRDYCTCMRPRYAWMEALCARQKTLLGGVRWSSILQCH